MNVSGTKEEKIKKFCEFMSLDDPDKICPIAREIFDRYLGNESNLKELLTGLQETVRTGGTNLNPQLAQYFLKNSAISQLEQLFFLTAAGAQLTAEVTHDTSISINQFALRAVPGHPKELYTYTPPFSETEPNTIAVGVPWLIRFCGFAAMAADPMAQQRHQDDLHKAMRSSIKGGVEEAYHAWQHSDADKKAELEPLNEKRYGAKWRTKKYEEQAEALASNNPKIIQEFMGKDPVESDSKKFQGFIAKRVDDLLTNFLSSSRGR